MTKERSPTDADSVTDPLVTYTYRDFATERTPASINEALLRQASAHAANSYTRSILWLRPMAWAATIGLCLAIVVELSNVPQPEAVKFEQQSLESVAPASPGEVAGAPSTDDSLASEADGRQNRDYSVTFELNTTPSLESPPDDRAAGQSGGLSKSIERREQDTAVPVASPPTAAKEGNATADADAFHVTDAPILEEAADMARMREGPNQEAKSSTVESTSLESGAIESAPVAGFVISADVEDFADKSSCNPEARSKPESWLECIAALLEAGHDAVAEEERLALAEAFPEFETP